MSEENVEIVRRAWDAVVETGGVEAALDYFTEDCVMEDFPELPDRAVYRGREGIREIYSHFREMWGEFDQDPREFIDAGGNLIIVEVAMHGQGKGSGAPLNAKAFWVHEVLAGKIARMRAFTTNEQALEAAGLSE
jgi:ketosteroid isomerase-like protein